MKESSVAIHIPFSLESGCFVDLEKSFEFWHAPDTIQWFQEHGYSYQLAQLDESTELPHFGQLTEAQYPFAYYDSSDGMPLGALDVSGKVIFAQDSKGRHVAIKLVRTDTDELRVLRFLKQQRLETLREKCLIPVLDFLHNGDFTFVVMPRWGQAIYLPFLTEARDVLNTIHSTLKAIAFLHENNISHGDINHSNVLVNHFSDSLVLEENRVRANLRSQGLLLYAVFDFDFSVMLPPDADRTKCRLPYHRSFGTFNPTMDTAQGEFDYNPFVLDVGTMGVRFCQQYQHLTSKIPLLAPLLDRMTTHDLQRRFTALEALHFFEDMFFQLTEEELGRPVETQFEFWESDVPYDRYDRWKLVPPAFAEKWAAYKTPPVPLTTRALRAINRLPYMCHVIPWIRRYFHILRTRSRRLRDKT